MSVYFYHIDTTILHVPKTGGIFVKDAANTFRVPHKVLLAQTREETTENLIGSRHSIRTEDAGTVIAFVRNPVGWYYSYWLFKAKTGRLNLANHLDTTWHGKFETFIQRAFEKYPEGYLSTVIKPAFYDIATNIYPLRDMNVILSQLLSPFSITKNDLDAMPRSNVSLNRQEQPVPVVEREIYKTILNKEGYFVESFHNHF